MNIERCTHPTAPASLEQLTRALIVLMSMCPTEPAGVAECVMHLLVLCDACRDRLCATYEAMALQAIALVNAGATADEAWSAVGARMNREHDHD